MRDGGGTAHPPASRAAIGGFVVAFASTLGVRRPRGTLVVTTRTTRAHPHRGAHARRQVRDHGTTVGGAGRRRGRARCARGTRRACLVLTKPDQTRSEEKNESDTRTSPLTRRLSCGVMPRGAPVTPSVERHPSKITWRSSREASVPLKSRATSTMCAHAHRLLAHVERQSDDARDSKFGNKALAQAHGTGTWYQTEKECRRPALRLAHAIKRTAIDVDAAGGAEFQSAAGSVTRAEECTPSTFRTTPSPTTPTSEYLKWRTVADDVVARLGARHERRGNRARATVRPDGLGAHPETGRSFSFLGWQRTTWRAVSHLSST